jgi:glycosyltransferase involved in cell wall biosynthesis
MPAMAAVQPDHSLASGAQEGTRSVAVVIPTRRRPQKLASCLESLDVARHRLRFPVYVCDSSPTEEERAAVREVCARYEWVTVGTHEGRNVSAARNFCTSIAKEDLLVNIDDDLELEPEAIDRIVACYEAGRGRRVVSGSVSWGTHWTTPVKTRRIGYGRPPREDEAPDFITGAFFLYPRALGLALPWNERIVTADDIFIGAVWRRHGVQMLFAPDARAYHPELPASFDPARMAEAAHDQRWHIYVLLFDALFASRSLRKLLAYETLGFMASAKLFLRQPRWAPLFLRSWLVGHLRLFADRRYLRELVSKELPADVQ